MLCSWQRVFTICLFFSLREMFATEIDHSLDCTICNGYQICGRRQSQIPSCINGFPCTEEQYYLCGKIDETTRSQECERPGKFSDPDSLNKFYTCEIDDNTLDFKKQTFTCPTHTTYDLLTRHCLTTNERNLLSIVQNYNERERTEEQKFFCKDFGIFADPYDCKIYHSCNPKLESQDFYCSFGKYFDGSDCTVTKSKWCMQQLIRQNEKQTRQAEKIYKRIKQFQKGAPPSSDDIPTLKDDESNKQRETVTPLSKLTAQTVNYENNGKRTTQANDVTATTVGNEYDEEDATSPQESYVTATTVEDGYIEDGTTAVPVSDVTTITDIHDYNGNGTTTLPVNDVTAITLDDENNEEEATETNAGEASRRIFHDIQSDEDDEEQTTVPQVSDVTAVDNEYIRERGTVITVDKPTGKIMDNQYNKEKTTAPLVNYTTRKIVMDDYNENMTALRPLSHETTTTMTNDNNVDETTPQRVSDVTTTSAVENFNDNGTTRQPVNNTATTTVHDDYNKDGTTGLPPNDVKTTNIHDNYTEYETTVPPITDVTTTIPIHNHNEDRTTGVPVTDVRSITSIHDYYEDGKTGLPVTGITTTTGIDNYNKNGMTGTPMTNVTTTSVHDDFMEVGMRVLPVTDVRTTTRISPTTSTNFVKILTPFYRVQGNDSETEKTTHSPKFTSASTEISAPKRNKTLHHSTSTTPHTTTKKMWRATSRRTQKTPVTTRPHLRFRCPHRGYFRDPNDCHSFYRCKTVWKPCSSCKKRKMSFRVTHHTCKHGKWLSKFFWICVHSRPLGC